MEARRALVWDRCWKTTWDQVYNRLGGDPLGGLYMCELKMQGHLICDWEKRIVKVVIINNEHLLRANYVSGADLNTVHAWVYMILTTTNEGFLTIIIIYILYVRKLIHREIKQLHNRG